MRSALKKAREAPTSTKARILATAEEIFAAKGFDGASTREIAAAAAVNISSLHYHWESKETLYFAVFQNVYDRIVEALRGAIPQANDGRSRRQVIEDAMGTLLDFFAANPTIPKLLLRRLIENEAGHADVEQQVLAPAWKLFAEWMRAAGDPPLSGIDAQMFMLTVEGIVLLYLVDSHHFRTVLGASVQDGAMRRRVRRYLIELTPKLLQRGRIA